MGESQVAQECAQWIENGEGVTVAPYCSLGECQLRVTARGRDEAEALRQVEPVVDAICGVLGDCVYDVTETSDGSMQEAAGARAGGAAFDRFDGGELHGRHGCGQSGGLSRHFRMSV